MTTYTQLKTDIQAYLENDATEFTSQIDTFLDNAELAIYRAAELDFFQKASTSTLTASNEFLAKPSDFVKDTWLKLIVSGSFVSLTYLDSSAIYTIYPSTTATGQPRFYSDWDDDTFILGPRPDLAYQIEMMYKYRPAALSGSNETSWLSTNAGDLLLYRSLMEAIMFDQAATGDLAMYEKWETLYKEELAKFINEQENLGRRKDARYGRRR